MPAEGRHVVRRYAGDAAQHVLVFTGTSAPRRGRGRRARPAEEDAAPVDVTRISVIGAEPLADAEAWLRAAGEATVVGGAPGARDRAARPPDRHRRPAPRRARAAPPARHARGLRHRRGGRGGPLDGGAGAPPAARAGQARGRAAPAGALRGAARRARRHARLRAARDARAAGPRPGPGARGRPAARRGDRRRARGARGLARPRRDAGADRGAARAGAARRGGGGRRPGGRARRGAPRRRSRACSAASRPRCARAPPAPRSDRSGGSRCLAPPAVAGGSDPPFLGRGRPGLERILPDLDGCSINHSPRGPMGPQPFPSEAARPPRRSSA